MARNDPTIYMRIPQELKDLLDSASEANRRSMTAEVVARLQDSFQEQQGISTSTRELMAMAFFAGGAAKDPGQTNEFFSLLDRMFPASGVESSEIENWIDKARNDLSKDKLK